MNFALGYLLYQERDKIRAQTQEHRERGEQKFMLKIAEWVEKEVLYQMKTYDMAQNHMEVDVSEEEEEQEDEEVVEDEEEREQRKWIAIRVRELLTNYQYEAAAMRQKLYKVADEALQVNI